MDFGNRRVFRLFENKQHGQTVRGVKRHYRLFIVVVRFDDLFYYRGYPQQRKNIAKKKTKKDAFGA